MKKILFVILVCIVFSFSLFNHVKAYDSSDTGWKISEFDVSANINANRSVDITEEINVDFGALERHGIFRYIPYKYSRNGNNYSVIIKLKSITDENGNAIKYKES